MRTRKDVWKLASTDETLLWYGRAIAAMQKRPVTDATSWRYQAAIHDYDPSSDPLAVPGETLPPAGEQSTYWARCQHGSWFFLPWHRGYLFYFEQILRKAIQKLNGPSDWALPYWNYSDSSNPKARALPPAFYAAKLSDGSPNPLLVTQRAPGANTGQLLGVPSSADNSSCLKKPVFPNSSGGGATGFGGGRTGFSHNGSVAGECERVPHNTMHGAVGGATGWMSAFNTAGLDPVFWLHHANIDRLWEVWRKRDSKHANPTLAAWLSAVKFNFHDGSGSAVTLTVQQVLDTTGPLLDYVYEDVSDPLAPAPQAAPVITAAATMEQIPEMVGATDTRQAISLGAETSSIQFAVREPSGPALQARAAGTAGIHLNLENITASGHPIESYLVYLNLPDGANPEDHADLRAGEIPRFGIVEASRATREHAGDGVSYAFDVTEIVSALERRGAWNPASVHVTFVPIQTAAERSAPRVATKPVQIGRVSLYFA